MNANLDSKTIARNVWQDSMRDGLMEMLLGLYFLLTGIVIYADMSALFIIFMAFFPAIAKKMKERYTHPRIGYVKFPEHEKSPGRRILAALIGAVIAVAMVVVLAQEGEKTQALYKWVALLPALILAAGFSFTGQKTGFARHYAMAAFALIAGVLVPFADLPRKLDNIALYMVVAGSVFLVWGTAIFIHFLRTYPIRAEEPQ
jgi:peptidoglycan/LPS O-acetylase OafA/YrhL